jgi:hypothetical protein
MFDRRRSARKPVEIMFNKYLTGHPYLCRALELSERGLLAQTYTEPSVSSDSFSVEIQLPDQARSLWAWARAVRQGPRWQAIELSAMSPADRLELARFVAA